MGRFLDRLPESVLDAYGIGLGFKPTRIEGGRRPSRRDESQEAASREHEKAEGKGAPREFDATGDSGVRFWRHDKANE
jgi:hypothetical protein